MTVGLVLFYSVRTRSGCTHSSRPRRGSAYSRVPWDPRIWITFAIHDWGYVGKERMDDADGETHVERRSHHNRVVR